MSSPKTWKANRVQFQMDSTLMGVYQIGVNVGYLNKSSYLRKDVVKVLDSFKPTIINLLKISKFPSRFFIAGKSITTDVFWNDYSCSHIVLMYNCKTQECEYELTPFKDTRFPLDLNTAFDGKSKKFRKKHSFIIQGLKLFSERIKITKIIRSKKNTAQLLDLLFWLNAPKVPYQAPDFSRSNFRILDTFLPCFFCKEHVGKFDNNRIPTCFGDYEAQQRVRYITCYNSLGARLSVGKLPFNVSLIDSPLTNNNRLWESEIFTYTKIFNPLKLLAHEECYKAFSLLPDYDILYEGVYNSIYPMFRA